MRRILVPITALALVAAACSSGEPSSAPTPVPSTGSPAPAGTAAPATTTAAPAAPRGLLEALELSEQADPGAWVQHDGIVAYVAPAFMPGAGDPGQAAAAYFETFAAAYGIADPPARLETVSVTGTVAGTVVRFRQSLDGLPVFAGDVAVTVDADGTVTGVAGVIAPDAALAPAVLSADEAVASALDVYPGAVASGEDAPRPVVFSPALSGSHDAPVPAWEVAIVTFENDQVPIRHQVVVSGLDGAILLRAPLDLAGEQWDVYDAWNDTEMDDAELMIETRGGETTIVGDADETALAVAGHMSTTWAYFSGTHGRDGHDDAGGLCRLHVHVGLNWRNATAGGASCYQRYGDALPYAEELDVVAHEFTHAVTGQTAGLVYQGASGAVNEHYSDFFATMVDTSDWAISPTSRVMSSPAIDSAGEFLITEDDDGGVHDNSGIANMAAYLATNPGLNVHPDSGIEVDGIGRSKAEQIWYATLLSLTPRSGLGAWACATIRTAADAEGDLLTEDDVTSVTDAMVAVGLVEERDDGRLVCGWVGAGFGAGGGFPIASPPPTPTTTTAPEGTEACELVGLWRLRDQEFFDEIQSTYGGGFPGTIEYESGDYFVELAADGTTVGTRDDWSFRVATDEGSLITQISSVDPGEYTVDGNVITVNGPDSQAEVSLWVEQNGVRTPVPMGAVQTVTVPGLANATGTYSCVGDVLIIDMDTEEGVVVRATFDRVG